MGETKLVKSEDTFVTLPEIRDPAALEISSVDSEGEVEYTLVGLETGESDTSEDSSDEEEPSEESKYKTAENDDEDTFVGTPNTFATVHEVLDPPICLPTIALVGPDEEIDPIGEIVNIIDSVVVVQGYKCAATQSKVIERALDSESLLVFDDRQVLGQVFETFGPTSQPLYSVRFPSKQDIDMPHVYKGRTVYHVPKRSNYVFPRAIALFKGSDASNVHDEEPAVHELDFSDDEEEHAAKRRQKSGSRGREFSTKADYAEDANAILPYDETDPYAMDSTTVRPSFLPPLSNPVKDPYDEEKSVRFHIDPFDSQIGSYEKKGFDMSGRNSSIRDTNRLRSRRGRGPLRHEAQHVHYGGQSSNFDHSSISRQYRTTGFSDSLGNSTQMVPIIPQSSGPSMHATHVNEISPGLLQPSLGEPYYHSNPSQYVAPHINPRFANAFALNGVYDISEPFIQNQFEFGQVPGYDPHTWTQYGHPPYDPSNPDPHPG